jgi:hypothetical protein
VNLRVLILLAVALTALTCSQSAPPEDPGVVNAELGIKLVSVPDSLTVVANEGRTLVLKPTAEGAEGSIVFAVGPEQSSVNLVAAVQNHQARIEAMPDGAYKGGQELTGDFGTAFYSRGRFSENGETVEETVLFLIHPSASRLLEMRYLYPAGNDSAARVEQLISVLGQLE